MHLFATGADGAISLRLLKALASSGERVVAGVLDGERGAAALSFARKYELLTPEALSNIKLVEIDPSDVESLAAALPRRGRVLVVDGDQPPTGRSAAADKVWL